MGSLTGGHNDMELLGKILTSIYSWWIGNKAIFSLSNLWHLRRFIAVVKGSHWSTLLVVKSLPSLVRSHQFEPRPASTGPVFSLTTQWKSKATTCWLFQICPMKWFFGPLSCVGDCVKCNHGKVLVICEVLDIFTESFVQSAEEKNQLNSVRKQTLNVIISAFKKVLCTFWSCLCG